MRLRLFTNPYRHSYKVVVKITFRSDNAPTGTCVGPLFFWTATPHPSCTVENP